MLAIITVIVVFSFVILLHEFGHFILARRIGVRVERFSLGFGKALWSKRIGDTEYAISAIPFGGYIKMAGEDFSESQKPKPYEFYSKPPGKRFWVLFAGAALNYAFAFMIFCFIIPTSRVGIVLKDMPAFKAGIQTKDLIKSIDGKVTRYWYEVLDIISKDIEAKPLKIKLERAGELLEVEVSPSLLESKDIFGRSRKAAKIGIAYYGDVELLNGNVFMHLTTGLRQAFDNSAFTYKYIWRLITGKISIKGSVTGPIGMAVILGKAAKIGFVYLLYLVAHINLALAIFNLLPFPVLDGGHILFLGLEKIRNRPLNVRLQEFIQYVAIALLIAFMLFVSYNDIFLLKFIK